MAEPAAAARSRTLDLEYPPPPALLCWLVLVVISFIDAARAYVYDCIGPMARLLSVQLHFSNADIGLLQAACSLPNLLTVFLGGIIIDRIGVRKATAIFASLCLIGAIISALSPRHGVMLTGRLIYGLGSGSLSVAVSTGIAKWFSGARMSFVFGLSLTISRLGSLVAQTSPVWALWAFAWWRTPLLLAVVAGILCLLCAGIYWVMEDRAAKRYNLRLAEGSGRIAWRGMLTFNSSYWLIVLLCVTFYAGIFPFQTFAQKFFVEARATSLYLASVLVGVPTVIAMIATPLFGLLVDRIGRRAQFMMFGTALLVPVYLLMGYGQLSLFVPVTMMGIAFALVPAVMYPAVMLVVPQDKLGKAFGLMSMILSIGLSGFNFLIGWANDFLRAGSSNPSGYRLGMWLFSTSVLLSFGFAILLRRKETGPCGHGLETVGQPLP